MHFIAYYDPSHGVFTDFETAFQSSMEIHAYNPSIQEAEAGGL
jgi:hypothetical protein